MDKHLRKKGEKFLVEWGNCIQELNNYQYELDRLHSQLSIFDINNTINNTHQNNINTNINFNNKSTDDFSNINLFKNEVLEIYKEVLTSQQSKLRKMLSNYALVNSVILNIDPYKQNIIRLRYINKLSWQTVSMQTHTSMRHCFNIKNSIILNILDIHRIQKNTTHTI